MNYQEDVDDMELIDIENPGGFDELSRNLGFSFRNTSEIRNFLLSNTIHKNNIQRLFAWLITFGILPIDSTKWNDSIHSLFSNYQILIRTNLIDAEEDPLKLLNPEDVGVITADITRILIWFNEMAAFLQIPETECIRAKVHAYRAITLYYQTKNFKYAQGHDRYFFIAYLLSLFFTSKNGLSSEVAECLSFHLAYALIEMGKLSRFLDNPKQTQKHFEHLDEMMEDQTPDIYDELNKMGQSSIHFALRWEVLIFSDEYDIESIFYIWDNVIIRRSLLEPFMYALCISHLKQIPQPKRDEMMIETIQHFRNFDAKKAVRDAVLIYGGDPVPYSPKAAIIAIVILVLLLCLYEFIK